MTAALSPASIVHATLGAWAERFGRLDWTALVNLYSSEAMLFGSKAELHRRHDGVLAYFTGLTPRSRNSVRFENIEAEQAGVDAINLAGFAIFQVEDHAPVRMRLTQALVRDGDRWRIACHHASPCPQ